MRGKRIGEVLCQMGVLGEGDITGILSRQRQTRQKFGQIAVRLGLATHEQVWEAWALQLAQREAIEPADMGTDTLALTLIPLSTARRYGIVPLRAWGQHLVVAAPHDWPARSMAELAEKTRCRIHVCNAERPSIRKQLQRLAAKEQELLAVLDAS